VRFDDLLGLLEAFGFELKRISGSHPVYKHPAVPHLLLLQPTDAGQAKPYQVRQLLKLIEEYELVLDEEPDGEDEA